MKLTLVISKTIPDTIIRISLYCTTLKQLEEMIESLQQKINEQASRLDLLTAVADK